MSSIETTFLFFKKVWNILTRGPLTLSGIKSRITGVANFCISTAALLSRHAGHRAILIVGISASIYASFLFFSNQITPDAPQASHDVILKSRWAGPAASKSIIILDIDERSLAKMAPEHGRWPWPRSVLADGLDRLSQVGAKAVLFNVLLTDADKFNPDADSAMEAVAAMTPNVAYPMIRLNPLNDEISQLKVSKLLKMTGDPQIGEDKTVAVLLPMFEPMQNRVGVSNQTTDGDGIIRRYAVNWTDSRLTMPSIVSRTISVGGEKLPKVPDTINLNWRNKSTNHYKRVSFYDFVKADLKDSQLNAFKDAYVILGVSAPGLGMTKATSVSSLEDDNEIIATALDDVLHDTHIRVMSSWVVLVLELAAIWAIIWIGLGNSLNPLLNKLFILAQSGSATITMVSASYTNYLLDLSPVMAFGLVVFSALKLVQSLDHGWSRAKPGLRASVNAFPGGDVLLIGYRDSNITNVDSTKLQKFLESRVGLSRVIRVDDLFGGESFARKACDDYSCQFCLVQNSDVTELRSALKDLTFYTNLDVRQLALDIPWNPEQDEFRLYMAPHMLRQCADLINAYSSPSKGLD